MIREEHWEARLTRLLNRVIPYSPQPQDLFAVSLMIPLMMPHIQQLGVSPFLNGILGSVFGALQLISSPQMGRWSDTRGRKSVLSMCLVVSAAGYFVLGMASSLLAVLLARIIAGLFKHTQTLSRAMVLDLSSDDQMRSKVLGNFNSLGSMGFIVGPTIGGHMAEHHDGFFWICCLVTAVFLLNWVLLCSCDDTATRDSSARESHSFSFLREFDWISCWDILLLRFLLSFSAIVYRSNFSLVLHETFGATPKEIGYLISLQGTASALSGFLSAPLSRLYSSNHKKELLHFTFLQMLALVGLTWSPSILLVSACLIPFSLSNAVLRVSCTQVSLDRTDAGLAGFMMGLGQSVSSLARMVSPAVAGLAQEVHLRGPGAVGVFTSAAGVGLITFMLKEKDKVS